MAFPSLKVVKVEVDSQPLHSQFCRRIFDAVHGLAHPGIRATMRLISSHYLWPDLAAKVTNWCRSCQYCQRAKVTRQPLAVVQPIQVPTVRFSHVHLDVVGPLPCTKEGFTHLLTAVVRPTQWAEALPLKATAASDCAEAFITGWVARYGVPAVVTSDRGVQFTSSFWAAMTARLGIRHKLTTAFHPQANGAVDRFHRQLKDTLRPRLAGADWFSHLPWVMLGLRAVPRENSGLSAAELVFGAPLTLPGPIINAAEPPPEVFIQQL
jgi:Integrase zinc binding domain/Integrase core domain